MSGAVASLIGSGGGSVGGGIVLVGYAAAVALCGLAWHAAGPRGERRTWLFVAVILALLAIEKATHLEALLVHHAERIARAGGWYAARRGPQLAAIEGLAAAGFLFAIGLGWRLRKLRFAVRAAAAVTVLLLAFVAVRAVSLHQMDRLLATGIGPLRISNVVELAALALILAAAWSARRAHIRGG